MSAPFRFAAMTRSSSIAATTRTALRSFQGAGLFEVPALLDRIQVGSVMVVFLTAGSVSEGQALMDFAMMIGLV